jgi:4-hydroxy-tetrahydrodipicolinate synthase
MPFKKDEYGQVITAMATPFVKGDKHQVDYPATEKLIEHLINTGTDSLIISGTTGESPTLTHEEEIELLVFVKKTLDKLKSKAKIIFGAGSNSTQTAIKMSKLAEANGADALLIVTPYYNKPNQKGMKDHFTLIAKSTQLPIILYNVPGRCVVGLKAETIIELAKEHKNIIALKEASNNIDLISEIRQELDQENFAIYSGDDSLTLAMLATGADGVISVASHFVGNQMQEMIKAFNSGNNSKAIKIHLELFPLFSALFVEPNPTCVKEALEIIGLCSNELREPLVALNPEQKKNLEKIINKLVVKPSLV